LGVGRVLIVDREAEAGGVPRHSAHTGFGLRDQRRVMTGPAYARHYARAAARAGAEVRAGTTVTGWLGWPGSGGAADRPRSTPPPPGAPPGAGARAPPPAPPGPADPAGATGPLTVTLTSAGGLETVTASAVLLATGCRERPRAARLVPGGRPPGVMTTGELQQ